MTLHSPFHPVAAVALLLCLGAQPGSAAAAAAQADPSAKAASAVAATAKTPPSAGTVDAPVLIGTFKSWSAYSYEEHGAKVCYMADKLGKSTAKIAKRKDAFLMVTHRPAAHTLGVVSYVAGYTLQKGKDITVKVGDKPFTLFTNADTGWARDDATDHAIVAALRHESVATITAPTAQNVDVTDTFDLAGADTAYKAISDACKVK